MKCKFCGREFTRLVNKNMHEKYCKKGNNDEVIDKVNKKINDDSKECKHDFVLLNEKIENQRQAISQGYNAYCKKCNELT
jgi:hypothetical protein